MGQLSTVCSIRHLMLSGVQRTNVVPARCRNDIVMKFLNEYHVSLGRTVPIRIHQVDSIVPMLRRKFESQRRCVLSSA